jgi:hypothetical protein
MGSAVVKRAKMPGIIALKTTSIEKSYRKYEYNSSPVAPSKTCHGPNLIIPGDGSE